MSAVAVRLRALSSASSPISECALSMRALALVARALGPRRSHSISRAHAVFQRLLPPALRFEERLFLFEEAAVVAARRAAATRVNGIDFGDLGGDVLEKVAVVADGRRGEAAPSAALPATRCPRGRGGSLARPAAGRRGATTRACAMARRFRQPPERETACSEKSMNPARPRVSRICLASRVAGTCAWRIASSITDQTVCSWANSEICDT